LPSTHTAIPVLPEEPCSPNDARSRARFLNVRSSFTTRRLRPLGGGAARRSRRVMVSLKSSSRKFDTSRTTGRIRCSSAYARIWCSPFSFALHPRNRSAKSAPRSKAVSIRLHCRSSARGRGRPRVSPSASHHDDSFASRSTRSSKRRSVSGRTGRPPAPADRVGSGGNAVTAASSGRGAHSPSSSRP